MLVRLVGSIAKYIAIGALLHIGWGLSAQAAPLCEVLLNRESDGESELVMRKDGELAGLYRYRMIEEQAYVTGIFMQESHKRQGLSSEFVSVMLERNPETKSVKALLVLDNLAATGLVFVRRAITDEECVKAVGNSPFVKVFTRFGFTVSECRWDDQSLFLEIEMTKA